MGRPAKREGAALRDAVPEEGNKEAAGRPVAGAGDKEMAAIAAYIRKESPWGKNTKYGGSEGSRAVELGVIQKEWDWNTGSAGGNTCNTQEPQTCVLGIGEGRGESAELEDAKGRVYLASCSVDGVGDVPVLVEVPVGWTKWV